MTAERIRITDTHPEIIYSIVLRLKDELFSGDLVVGTGEVVGVCVVGTGICVVGSGTCVVGDCVVGSGVGDCVVGSGICVVGSGVSGANEGY